MEILFDQRVDLVLLDLDLPELDGLEVLSRIKHPLRSRGFIVGPIIAALFVTVWHI